MAYSGDTRPDTEGTESSLFQSLRDENEQLREKLYASEQEKRRLLSIIERTESSRAYDGNAGNAGLRSCSDTSHLLGSDSINKISSAMHATPHGDSHEYTGGHETRMSTDAETLKVELIQLQRRYDLLLEEKKRAAARHKEDYVRWRRFKDWLLEDDQRAQLLRGTFSEKKKRDYVPCDGIPKTELPPILPDLSDHAIRALDSPSPNISYRPHLAQGGSAWKPDVKLPPIASFMDSDTEEDSQAPPPMYPSRSVPLSAGMVGRLAAAKKGITSKGKNIAGPQSVQRPVERSGCPRLQSQLFEGSRTPPLLPAKLGTSDSQRAADEIQDAPDKENTVILSCHQDQTRSGRRRISTSTTRSDCVVREEGMSISTKKESGDDEGVLLNVDTSINSRFVINQEANGGVGYQYEGVVRKQKDRKHLQGGDCECCRDYYDAIGALPSRLEAPLWRTPPKTVQLAGKRGHTPASPEASPSEKRARSHEGRAPTDIHAMRNHKNDISRHRHQWAPPSTPPGYWNIGFPDTQEAVSINQRANDMHRMKMEAVEAEARDGGKYKKRK